MTRPAITVALASLALVLPLSAARAQGVEPCADESSTVAVNACLARRVQAQDAALAQTFERLRASWRARDAQAGGVAVLPALEAAQEAWAQYRQRECAARALAYGVGTGAPAAGLRCELSLSILRRTALMREWDGS